MEQTSPSNSSYESQRASNLKGVFQEAGQQASDAAKKVVNELSIAGKETLETVGEKGKKQIAGIEDYIRKYPLRSVGFGALVGVIFNRLLR